MSKPVHILHLEDDAADAELVRSLIEAEDMACRIAVLQTRDQFTEALREGELDLILADYRLPAYDGLSAMRVSRELCPDVPFIFVSGTMGEDPAIEALTEGATDYVLKQRLSRLAPAVKRALREVENQRKRIRAEKVLGESEEQGRCEERLRGDTGGAVLSPGA
jgi:DNA-binding NtrC family response regulator